MMKSRTAGVGGKMPKTAGSGSDTEDKNIKCDIEPDSSLGQRIRTGGLVKLMSK